MIDQIVNYPKYKQQNKVVQLYIDDLPYLVVQSNKEGYHRTILLNFLKSKGIDPKTYSIEGKVLPELNGEQYDVVGMGVCTFYEEERIFMSGKSMDYGLDIDKDHANQIAKLLGDWSVKVL